MGRFLAALFLVLMLAPEAWAQIGPGHELRTVPTPAEVAAQASLPTSYLLSLYMMELASAGSPPSQSDIDEATRQYLTNGAAVTGVPTDGPGADYFRNGAAVLAYHAPQVAPALEGAREVVAGPAPTASASPDAEEVEDASSQSPPATAAVASAVAPTPSPSGSGCPTCATLEQFEAALANASRGETPPPPVQTSDTEREPTTGVSRPTGMVSASGKGHAVDGPSGPSPWSRVATVLGGALFGGLVVVLWSRPRPLRAARRRSTLGS